MASKIGTYLVHKWLDYVFGNTAYTPPATVYVELFTTAPTDYNVGTGGTAVSGGSYARASVTNNTTNFANAASRSKATGADVTFATPSAGWGTVTAFGLYDASTGGNWLGGGDLTTSKTINSGDTVKFNTGSLTISIT